MFRYVSLVLVLILSTAPVWADEVEIRSTGGAYLGKFEYSEIDATDALLNIELSGRKLVSVKAGYIGNNAYREYWSFDNSHLTYDKLTGGYYYRPGTLREQNAGKLICGFNVELKCESLKSEKVSKNLVIVTYKLRQTGASCAALLYMDEEFPSEGYSGAYGDYFVRSVSCVPAGGEADEALARSAHYLSIIKKDGRRIANLARYDLPSMLSFPSKAPTPAGTREGSGNVSAAGSGAGEETAEFPIAFKWEGVTDLSAGTLTTSTKGSEGELSVSLKNDAGNCTGKWERKGGKPRTVEGAYGVWYLRCDSGLAASGSYEMIGRRQGAGEGKDSNGRDVTFAFGR